ncbi:Protein of unknown function (DUF3124) [Saprospira grandis DSM 2844]|uniref:DUF3124 domain-containing protein n=1 Tax=Saprospira grandis DSM 2844 TaxID=694433 RepID=J1I7B9_9BACT|nr:DUF3124 domain-containing protein [Saprospira grandis]EJF54695.1 Protein of unknown function (DUF3124) [Saprospira grandis DSM 2844]
MKWTSLFFLLLLLSACQPLSTETSSIKSPVWEEQTAAQQLLTPIKGEEKKSYLSVYPAVFSLHEGRQHQLTVTLSLRNRSPKDSLYISQLDYYNGEGELLRNYLEQPIFLRPLQTLSLVLNEKDKEGGTGASFIINWLQAAGPTPIFEAIMISTSGQQGLSFRTQAEQID